MEEDLKSISIELNRNQLILKQKNEDTFKIEIEDLDEIQLDIIEDFINLTIDLNKNFK